MLAQYEASIAHDDEHEVNTHSPESANGDDAAHTLRL